MDSKPGGAQRTPKKGAKGGAESPQVTGGAKRMPKKRSQGRAECPEVASSPDSNAAEDEMGDSQTRKMDFISDTDRIMSLCDKMTSLELTVADQAQTLRSITEPNDGSIAELKTVIMSLCDKISNLELTVAAQAETLEGIAADNRTAGTWTATLTQPEATPATPPSTPLPAMHAEDALQRQRPQAAETPPGESLTKKHQSFVTEPMLKKKVKEMPGVAGTLGERLISNGFEYAYQVLGHYLELGMSETKFKQWLKKVCDARTQDQNACYEAVKDWCEYHHFP